MVRPAATISINDGESHWRKKTPDQIRAQITKNMREVNRQSILLIQKLTMNGLPLPIREFKFHEKRMWKADFYWHQHCLMLEAEGMIWTGGRHTHPVGYLEDMQKYNAAAVLGYRLLRVPTYQLSADSTIELLKEALGNRP